MIGRVKIGLIIVGIGETIADIGALVAKCERIRPHLYYRGFGPYEEPYAYPLKDDDAEDD